MSSPAYPFLVYGTLRLGQRNYRALGLERRTDYLGTTVLQGYRLYAGPGFPYAVGTGVARDRVTVDVLSAREGQYDSLIADVDALEGYQCVGGENHYEREGAPYRIADVSGEGWIYTASDWTREYYIERHGYPRIASGDWLAR